MNSLAFVELLCILYAQILNANNLKLRVLNIMIILIKSNYLQFQKHGIWINCDVKHFLFPVCDHKTCTWLILQNTELFIVQNILIIIVGLSRGLGELKLAGIQLRCKYWKFHLGWIDTLRPWWIQEYSCLDIEKLAGL